MRLHNPTTELIQLATQFPSIGYHYDHSYHEIPSELFSYICVSVFATVAPNLEVQVLAINALPVRLSNVYLSDKGV